MPEVMSDSEYYCCITTMATMTTLKRDPNRKFHHPRLIFFNEARGYRIRKWHSETALAA
jgi:hypothetical protein